MPLIMDRIRSSPLNIHDVLSVFKKNYILKCYYIKIAKIIKINFFFLKYQKIMYDKFAFFLLSC